MVARRAGGAWLVVADGDGLKRRLVLLAHLHGVLQM
jgi:hypothetical protein